MFVRVCVGVTVQPTKGASDTNAASLSLLLSFSLLPQYFPPLPNGATERRGS